MILTPSKSRVSFLSVNPICAAKANLNMQMTEREENNKFFPAFLLIKNKQKNEYDDKCTSTRNLVTSMFRTQHYI